jgi:phenylalanine-4-hydroxylase
MYTPEPDICHELIGHVPMLCNPAYCDLVHAIGVASLRASEKEIW